MKKISMLGALVVSIMALSINAHASTIEYNAVNSTYTNTVKTYKVGSGCSSNTAGVTCYSGDSYIKLLTENAGRKNNPMLVFYKDDIIEFVADTAKPSGNEGAAYGLNKGFIIVDGSYNDITSQYAEVITSVVSNNKIVYQKIKITSALPVQLLPKGAGGTGFESEPNSLRQKWADRVLYWNIGIYNKSAIPIIYDYKGGEFYGSATPPTSLYVTSIGYTFDLPVIYKEGFIFKGWSASNIISFDNSAKQTAKISGTTTWGSHTSSGLISTRESITLTPLFDYLHEDDVTITLNANGGKIDGYSSHIYITNIAVSPQNDGYLTGFGIENYIPVKSGSTFAGWYLDQALTQKVTKDSDVFYTRNDDNKKTLYAKWVPANTYTITINSGTGFTTNLTSPKTVNKNDDLEIIVTANNGYKLKSVKIDNVEQTLPLTSNKIVLTNITKNMEILVVTEEIIYNFDNNSKNLTYTIGTDEELSLRVEDATLDDFDKVLDSKYYTVESGSIIVKVKDSYLRTLKNGTYSIKVLTKDGGKATSSFVIANSSAQDESNPRTGDGIMISIIIGSISLVGLLGTSIYLKKI